MIGSLIVLSRRIDGSQASLRMPGRCALHLGVKINTRMEG
jgi:hypothetical protein